MRRPFPHPPPYSGSRYRDGLTPGSCCGAATLVAFPVSARPGRASSLVGAVAYAYTFFTGTVVYALAAATAHWSALQAELDPWMTVHGIPLIAAGIAFRCRRRPRESPS